MSVLSFSAFALVALGGACGACLRYGAGLLFVALLGPGFPYATLAVNVIGSLLMGAFIEASALGWRGAGGELRLFFAVGLLGAFTTFSTFSLDAIALYRRGELWLSAGYVLASVMLSIAALVAGIWLTRTLFSAP